MVKNQMLVVDQLCYDRSQSGSKVSNAASVTHSYIEHVGYHSAIRYHLENSVAMKPCNDYTFMLNISSCFSATTGTNIKTRSELNLIA